MDILLSKVTQQAMTIAIRSGISITSGYAIRQCSRLLRNVNENNAERAEIATLQHRLEAKIRIISPAIDMIELIAARGNTSLESAVTLTKQLRWDIQSLGVRLAKAATDEESQRKGSSNTKLKARNEHELKQIVADMRRLLERIEDAVPLINLAITTSGVNLSTTLPSAVSPSRLLQASTFLTAGDSRYAMAPGPSVQVGPIFTLSMYMLFSGHAYRPHDENGLRETTWKEVIHKARLKLLRVPLDKIYHLPESEDRKLNTSVDNAGRSGADEEYFPEIPSEGKAYEFAYQLLIIEDLDDDRVHTFDDEEQQPGPFEDVALAGIREALPVHEISKIFYADTGKILNIGTEGETNNPVLLLKRDVNAVPPRRMMDQQTAGPQWYDEERDEISEDEPTRSEANSESSATLEGCPISQLEAPPARPWSLPPNLDPEWIAFEVYTEGPDSDEEDTLAEEASSQPTSAPRTRASQASRAGSFDPSLTASMSNLHLSSTTPTSSPRPNPSTQLVPRYTLESPATIHSPPTAPTSLPALRTSLSLLELLIRLTALQQFQQCSHLAITDELLNFFLSEAGTTGAGGDSETRRRVRREARQRVGFDPYDESPVKRRGEEYLENYGHGSQYDGTDGAVDQRHAMGTPLSEQYSPRLADGYRGSPNEQPPIKFSMPSTAAARRTRPPQTRSPASSPGMSSPLARKSASRPETLKRGVNAGVGRSPLSQSESDSTLGTSPGSSGMK